MDTLPLFAPEGWFYPGRGPRYVQLHRHIAAVIGAGLLAPGDPLPPERDLARMAAISRVTVRKAVARLAAEGLIEQRQGAGSFVRSGRAERLEQSLSSLVSFSETMHARGMVASSRVLRAGLFAPSPAEVLALGLASGLQVARIDRLRRAGDGPVALEASCLPADILPDPGAVTASLYAVLRAQGRAPVRAIQRVTAQSLGPREAAHLLMPEGAAVLRIERTGYLASGRPIEFTSGLYRPDVYDFVSELRTEAG